MAAVRIKTFSKVVPQCYAYITPGVPAHEGWTKIGFTEHDVETRVRNQTHTAGVRYEIRWIRRAAFVSPPFDTFRDRHFHVYLKRLGVPRDAGTEWFRISPEDAEARFDDFTKNHGVVSAEDADATIPYTLREEQAEAVRMTAEYFRNHEHGEFLWNAKPRFGKTVSAYDLCLKLGARNILVVTNRPAVADSWYEDYETFLGPGSGYAFVSSVSGISDRKYVRSREEYAAAANERTKGCIEFVSLQDLKGSIYFGGCHDKLKELTADKGLLWDVMIVDEAHEGVDTYRTDTAFSRIRRRWTLHLSGTPFKALENEKFPADAIYNWTYADEQKKKSEWDPSSESENPYSVLPRLSLFTYRMSDIVRDKTEKGIRLDDGGVMEYAFDLNEFFRTSDRGSFVHDADVDRFLDALTKQEKFPFSTPELRDELKHTFWLLNRVASAKALAKKLHVHPVFKDYEIVLAAGDGRLDDDDENEESLARVRKAIETHDRTITLSVGQLTTGVTVPEWTAVMMLCNMASPALYMQAAFRAQNPHLSHGPDDGTYRKENAYVFDFDPARTLTIFEKFANDLIPGTSGDRVDSDTRKRQVRTLLNFFPVYGEDDDGSMIELDAEKVLTIPRRIHAREVVERGFMSNFLFANIGGIFSAPREIIDVINRMQALEEPRTLAPAAVDEDTSDRLNLNEKGEPEVPDKWIVGEAAGLFGKKEYGRIGDRLTAAVEEIRRDAEKKPDTERERLRLLYEQFSKPSTEVLMEKAEEYYGDDLTKASRNLLQRRIQDITRDVINREYGEYSIRVNQLEKERRDDIRSAQQSGAPMTEISRIDAEYGARRDRERDDMLNRIGGRLGDHALIKKTGEAVVATVETERRNAEKKSIEGDVRDHLRGFSRTIPAFLMAYGDEHTTLANFDSLVPEDVFWEVTVNPQNGQGVTLEQFRMMRDGGDYTTETGEKRHFDGHLFDEVVFNDAVQEFMRRRAELADYFEPGRNGDIFDFIPPQRTNQIFTPKKIVKDMVDMLEKENPGCFDDPEATFADLYMKSGMYITEIVTRLYRSGRMKALYPDAARRLNHIFAEQVYGCAPTEIIYRICLRSILGFSDEIHIEKHNIRLCDTLKHAKEGTLEKEVRKLFPL